jgi:adenosylhomocysteine nucleosidase
MIGIVAAMPEERAALLSGLGRVVCRNAGGYKLYSGSLGGVDYCLVESGMGYNAAAKAAEFLVGACAPELLVSAGFCGAVRPGAVVADLVVSQKLLYWNGRQLEEVNPPGLDLLSSRVASGFADSGLQFHKGSFVTTSQIVSKTEMDAMLEIGLGTPVLEMESAAVARVAMAHGISFIGVRAISDDAALELGFSLDEFCDDQLVIRPAKVLRTCLKRPTIIPQLLKLAYYSSLAGRSLGKAMVSLLGSYQERS